MLLCICSSFSSYCLRFLNTHVGNFTVSFCVAFMPFILIVILEHECLDNFTVSSAYVLWI